jgi:hypothetical protein
VPSLHFAAEADPSRVYEQRRLALKQRKVIKMEWRHAENYARRPVEPGEFGVWVEEQAWGEPRAR